MNTAKGRRSLVIVSAILLVFVATPSFGAGIAERVNAAWEAQMEARRQAEAEAAREAAEAEAEARRETRVGYLFNWVEYREPMDMMNDDGPRRDFSFSDRWRLYQDGMAWVRLDVSAVREEAEELYGQGVRVRGTMEGDTFVVVNIASAAAGDSISVNGRIIYEGTAVGPGGETQSTVFLIAETADGTRRIPLEQRPDGLLGRRVRTEGRPYLTRPTPTMGIQELLYEITSMEPAEPTPGEIVSELESAVLTRPNGEYTLIDLYTLAMYPVEVDLVEEEARRLVEYGDLFATVAVERTADGGQVYHLTSVGPKEVDGGLQYAYLTGNLYGTILPLGDRAPNADGYINTDILLMNDTQVTIPLESSYISRTEGHPVRIGMEWYAGGDDPNGVQVMGGTAMADSVWPALPVLMRPWRGVHYGWVEPLGDNRFGLVLRTGEGIEIDMSSLAERMGGIEAAAEQLNTMAELGGYVEVFGQLPDERRDDTDSLWAFEVTYVPGVGGLRLQGRVVETDESESGLGLSIGRAMDRVTVPLNGVSSRERSALSIGSWVTVSGAPFVHAQQQIGNAYIIGLEVERVW